MQDQVLLLLALLIIENEIVALHSEKNQQLPICPKRPSKDALEPLQEIDLKLME